MDTSTKQVGSTVSVKFGFTDNEQLSPSMAVQSTSQLSPEDQDILLVLDFWSVVQMISYVKEYIYLDS